MPTPVTLSPEFQTPGTSDFEIVLGRRQVASVLFLATVLVVAFSAVSYLAGKAGVAAAGSPIVVAFPPAPPAPVLSVTAVQPAEGVKPETPLFADPAAGAVYIQIGALDRGFAMVVADGLRAHQLDAFVAPGPADQVFRVLIGPLPDPASFQRVKDAIDQLGLSNFARRYEK